jgi:hypothetical protein
LLLTFDNPDDAGKALKSLRQIEKAVASNWLTPVIVKDAEAKPTSKTK